MTTISARRGFFRSVMDGMIAAREREAARCVSRILLNFDDARLAQLGYDRGELEKSRRY